MSSGFPFASSFGSQTGLCLSSILAGLELIPKGDSERFMCKASSKAKSLLVGSKHGLEALKDCNPFTKLKKLNDRITRASKKIDYASFGDLPDRPNKKEFGLGSAALAEKEDLEEHGILGTCAELDRRKREILDGTISLSRA